MDVDYAGGVQALHARQLLIGEVYLFALFFRQLPEFRAKSGKVVGVISLYGGEVGFADLFPGCIGGDAKYIEPLLRRRFLSRFFWRGFRLELQQIFFRFFPRLTGDLYRIPDRIVGRASGSEAVAGG